MTADFQAAWAAHQPAIEAAAKAGMDACHQQPSDHLMGKNGDELNQAHCDGAARLLREYLEGHGQA